MLRRIVLVLAGFEALVCALLLAYGFTPDTDQATAGLGMAYGIIGLLVIGVPAVIAALLARADKLLWLALALTLAPLLLIALMVGAL